MNIDRVILKTIALVTVSAVFVIAGFTLDPISQDPAYHIFVDDRPFLLIPNFLNIASNLIYVITGSTGLYLTINRRPQSLAPALIYNYLVFFLGILLIGLASAYYHYKLDNFTLFIDRIAIVIAFMAFMSIIIGEYVSQKYTIILMFFFITIGITSTVYWYISELNGAGDLRAYGIIQFIPFVLTALILLMYRSAYNDRSIIWMVLICYGIAKLFELSDTVVFEYTGFISGHSLKHLVSGIAPAILLYNLYHRSSNA